VLEWPINPITNPNPVYTRETIILVVTPHSLIDKRRSFRDIHFLQDWSGSLQPTWYSTLYAQLHKPRIKIIHTFLLSSLEPTTTLSFPAGWAWFLSCLWCQCRFQTKLPTYLPTYLSTYQISWLTRSMEHRISWDTDSHSASQDISRILWNPKVYCRV
jgi:hypothetical protein